MEKVKIFLKSKAFLYVVLAIFCFLLACLCKEYDYDLFARLIVGENFVKTGSVAYKDFLSYTPTHLWFDHEWGSGVVFYLFLKTLGPIGLVLIHAITMFCTILFILKTQQLQKHAYPISMAFILGFLLIFNHLNPSIIRCHTFTFMFYAITLYLLEKTRTTNSNILWLFVPITLFWNNLHGGIASGLGMIFIYMLCEIIGGKKWIKYFSVLFVSTLVLLINPFGIEYLDFLLFAYSIPRNFITEWQNVFVNRHILYYFPVFFTGLASLIFAFYSLLKNKKFNLTKFIASITTIILGTLHVKLLTIAIITISSLYYSEIMNLLSKNATRTLNKIAYICITLSLLLIPFTTPNTAITNFNKFPIEEVEFLKINKIKGNILTDFELGSYISYKLYPQNLIFMDGRFESVYNDKEFQNLMNFENGNTGWENAVINYPTEIVIFQNDSTASDNMTKLKDWTKVYQGSFATIFMKKDSKYIAPSKDMVHYQKTFFETMGHFGK